MTGSTIETSPQVYARLAGVCYLLGSLTTNGPDQRDELAPFDSLTGQLSAWNPMMDRRSSLYGHSSIAVDQDHVYAGGGFFTAGGQTRYQLAILDARTALATRWNPVAERTILDVSALVQLLFGQVSPSLAVRYGRADAAPDAPLALWDAMFRTEYAPFCPDMF